mmetsp:Transcript_18468/g.47208  ORF Transcript_18468/g.47208 Transcript_18468/m.47208 type:complete len:330 (-) Transcript_18468:992-1981(-)
MTEWQGVQLGGGGVRAEQLRARRAVAHARGRLAAGGAWLGRLVAAARHALPVELRPVPGDGVLLYEARLHLRLHLQLQRHLKLHLHGHLRLHLRLCALRMGHLRRENLRVRGLRLGVILALRRRLRRRLLRLLRLRRRRRVGRVGVRPSVRGSLVRRCQADAAERERVAQHVHGGVDAQNRQHRVLRRQLLRKACLRRLRRAGPRHVDGWHLPGKHGLQVRLVEVGRECAQALVAADAHPGRRAVASQRSQPGGGGGVCARAGEGERLERAARSEGGERREAAQRTRVAAQPLERVARVVQRLTIRQPLPREGRRAQGGGATLHPRAHR